ncbi:MAG: WG repeat-containing protein [Candidatus Melainabacteria bacterium]
MRTAVSLTVLSLSLLLSLPAIAETRPLMATTIPYQLIPYKGKLAEKVTLPVQPQEGAEREQHPLYDTDTPPPPALGGASGTLPLKGEGKKENFTKPEQFKAPVAEPINTLGVEDKPPTGTPMETVDLDTNIDVNDIPENTAPPSILPPKEDELKAGIINTAGDWIVKPQFQTIRDFSEGRAAVRINDHFGYVNEAGQLVIQPQFDEAGPFSQGLARVWINGKWGYIDASGVLVVQPVFEAAGDFSEDRAPVKLNGLFGYISANGEWAITPQFEDAYGFSGKLARVWKGLSNGHPIYSYINPKGEDAFQPTVAWCGDFSDGLAPFKISGHYGFMDSKGRPVIEARFDGVWPFQEGLALVKQFNKFGYINPKGEVVIEPLLDWADGFSQGLAPVRLGNQYGYINPKGKIEIAPQYAWAGNFRNGLAPVEVLDLRDRKKTGYINPQGQWVIDPIFTKGTVFSDGGLAVVTTETPE